MKSNNYTLMKVDPGFQKKLKVMAAERGCSIIELTRQLGNIEQRNKQERRSSKEWKFGF